MTNTLHAATALAGFMRATAGDLPEPQDVTFYAFRGAYVRISFHTLADLREWAQLLGVEVTGGDRLTHMGTYHHELEATWPAYDGSPVRLTSTFIVRPEPAECSSEMELTTT